jgi:hypothetical protein
MDISQLRSLLIVLSTATILLACGCVQKGADQTKPNLTQMPTMQNASAETSAKVRYVQLNFLDGTSVGGKYVSETAAFTTIQYMYRLDPGWADVTLSTGGTKTVGYPEITNESGAIVAFKNTLINTMIDIENPAVVIKKAQQERETAENEDKTAREKLGWPPSPLSHS